MNARYMFYSENHQFSNEEDKVYAREDLVYNVTEDILVIMEDMGINKKELADKLGKSRAYITQILSGSRNMTLGTFSDICFSLGFKPEIVLPVQEKEEHLYKTVETDSKQEVIEQHTNAKLTSANVISRKVQQWNYYKGAA